MIPRREFFGKLTAMLGLSSFPAQASEESIERIMRRIKMAEKGLGPDDVRIEHVWDRHSDGSFVLKLCIDCHGETYGKEIALWPTDRALNGFHILITPANIKCIETPVLRKGR